jgi:hypothetical protein
MLTDVAAITVEKVPEAQLVQEELVVMLAYVPGMHRWHIVDPLRFENKP